VSHFVEVSEVAKRLAMLAGSWFDRKDLSLPEREAAVAELIERELRACREAA
jgi:hypothetical protein